MVNIKSGLVAGFVATIVLTLLMMMKSVMGVMPELDPVHMMSDMVSEQLGMPTSPVVGWIMHFGVGTIAWGGLFSLVHDRIPSPSYATKGAIFGVGAWLLMMIGPMPMSGAGLFGLSIGPAVPVMTLVFHVIFGVVLGKTFERITRT